jgi:hypothetical protein
MSFQTRLALATRGIRGGEEKKYYIEFNTDIEDSNNITAEVLLDPVLVEVQAISQTPQQPLKVPADAINITISQNEQPVKVYVTDTPIKVSVETC